MKINKYKGIIQETAIFPSTVDNFGLAYSWLGIVEESDEARVAFDEFRKDPTNLDAKNAFIKELGDVCWYTASICNIVGLDEEEVFLPRTDLKSLSGNKSIIAYCGNIKKFYRDNKQIDKEELTGILNILINGIMLAVNQYGITLDEVLEVNYNKLMDRKKRGTIKGSGDDR